MAKRKREGQQPLFIYLDDALSARLEKYLAKLEKQLSQHAEQAGAAPVKISKAAIIRKWIEEGLDRAESKPKK